MKYLPGLTLCWLLAVPAAAAASVTISEVAWMGDTDSANYEWIELHNAGTSAVVIDGWQLRDAGSLTIDLQGEIAAGAYVVLERNRSSEQYLFTPPFLVYTGALVNSGTTLTLYQADDAIADQVAGGEDWQGIGGDNDTKETAQYTSQGWQTAPATPGAAPVTAPSGPASSSAHTDDERSSGSAGTVITGASQPETVRRIANSARTTGLQLAITPPTTAYVGQPVTLSLTASGVPPVIANSLTYAWNFGDTHSAGGNEVSHTYSFPGQYVVTAYAAYAEHEASARHTVIVLPITLSLEEAPEGDIHLHNDAPYEVDISGYRLVGDRRIVFPARSLLLPRSTITIASDRLLEQSATPVALYDQTGALVTHTAPAATAPLTTVAASAPVSPVTPAAVPAATTRNFSFASAASASATAAAVSTPTALTSSTPERIHTATTATTLPAHGMPPATAESAPDSAGWTIGGLVLLLGGTIGGLWWHRRLTPIAVRTERTD